MLWSSAADVSYLICKPDEQPVEATQEELKQEKTL